MPRARVRHTCTECSLRRQQCDRRVPCGRCIKRGVPEKCRLTWPDDQYGPSRQHVLSPSQPSAPAVASAGLTPTDNDSQSSDPGLLPWLGARPSQATTRDAGEPWKYYKPTAPRPRYVFKPYEQSRLRQSIPELPRGGSSWFFCSTYASPHGNVAPHEAFLQTLLPSVGHIWRLVDYHEQYLLWYHCCYHGPTFRSEVESVIAEQDDQITLSIDGLHLQWLALLFSVMAGSLTCAATWRLRDWGFTESEVVELSMQWYRAVIICLNYGEWTSDHNVYSVQAITTLTMAAHPLGCSAELSVLLGGALKIAQTLGLDQLDHEPSLDRVEKESSDEQRHRLLKRDIGRKLWCQMCVQDWMSLPFVRSYSMNPSHFTTTTPSSRNHLTMEHIPPTFPTYVSYGNYLFEITKLVVRHYEAQLQATTPFTDYQHVLDYDKQMRDLATRGMPRYFHVVEPVDALWPEWVHWARSSLTVCFAHKIIMIHRNYIRRSFTNSAYSFTRLTCVAAAKTILNESNQANHKDGPIIWIDKAFCVAAALVLCMDISYRPESDPERATHKTLVFECIEQLRKFQNSVIAVRGANLLSEILAERDSRLRQPLRNIDMSEMAQWISTTEGSAVIPGFGSTSSAELFPPPTGFNNKFLFEDLLGLNMV